MFYLLGCLRKRYRSLGSTLYHGAIRQGYHEDFTQIQLGLGHSHGRLRERHREDCEGIRERRIHVLKTKRKMYQNK